MKFENAMTLHQHVLASHWWSFIQSRADPRGSIFQSWRCNPATLISWRANVSKSPFCIPTRRERRIIINTNSLVTYLKCLPFILKVNSCYVKSFTRLYIFQIIKTISKIKKKKHNKVSQIATILIAVNDWTRDKTRCW